MMRALCVGTMGLCVAEVWADAPPACGSAA